MKKVLTIIFFLMFSFSCTAFAADWVCIDSADTYDTYVDSSSIRKIPYNNYNDNYYTCWSKMDFLSPDEFGTKCIINKIEFYNEIDGCYYRIASVTNYDENGTVIVSDDSNNEPLDSIPPGSILDKMYRFVVNSR